MQREKLLAYQCSEWQRRERFGEELEDTLVVLVPALSFKAVHPVHVIGFVIPTV